MRRNVKIIVSDVHLILNGCVYEHFTLNAEQFMGHWMNATRIYRQQKTIILAIDKLIKRTHL